MTPLEENIPIRDTELFNFVVHHFPFQVRVKEQAGEPYHGLFLSQFGLGIQFGVAGDKRTFFIRNTGARWAFMRGWGPQGCGSGSNDGVYFFKTEADAIVAKLHT